MSYQKFLNLFREKNRLNAAVLLVFIALVIVLSLSRGSIELSVRQDTELPKGMIFIPFCFSEAAANKLTNPQLDPFGKIPEFKYCAANIEVR